jgi:SSS family solute:Na+ symporter
MLQLTTANGFDYALIALYFGIVIWIGFYAARKNRGADDFFRASGQVPWFVAGVSSWVSGFSAFMFVAAAGYTYKHGTSAVILFTSAAWAYLAGYFYFAPMWRRARIDAPLQFLTRRYSPSTTYFYTVTAIVPQVIGIGQGIYILCIFVSSALGFEQGQFHFAGMVFTGLEATMLIVGVIMIVYSVAGGLWAAVLSDAIQGVIIIVMSVIIFPVTFMRVGGEGGLLHGFKRLFTDLPHAYIVPSGQPAQPLFLISYILAGMLGYNVAWHFAQRYNSVPSERDAKKMAMLGAILSLFGPMLWVLPVMATHLIFPEMSKLWPNLKAPEEASFVSLAMALLPHGMIGFVIAAILSATLGQANDAFNWLAAAITRDVYVPLRSKLGMGATTDKQELWVARLTMFVVGVTGVITAFIISKRGGAFDFALKYYSLTGPGFMMPVALGMIWRKTPWWSGMASCIAAFTAAFAFVFADAWPEHIYERNVLSAIIAATIVFVISAFFYREEDPASAECRKLDVDLRTPVADEGAVSGGALAVYGVIGNLSLVLGVVLIACTFLPSTAEAPGSINLISGALLIGVGFGLRRLAKLRKTS